GAELDDLPPADADAATSRSHGEAPPGYSEWASTGVGGRDNSDYNLEAFVSVEATLADHLAEQLALAVVDPARRMIGQYLIDLVDEAGYLNGDLALVAEKLGAPAAEIDAVLAILQGFDPPGVCARNLTECLAIQLKERNRFDPAMQALVAHLDLLANPDLPCGPRQGPEERERQGLSRRLPADRDVADPRARPARQNHPEGIHRDRAPAGRLFRSRGAAFAAAQPQDHRRRHRHARIDGLARHCQQ